MGRSGGGMAGTDRRAPRRTGLVVAAAAQRTSASDLRIRADRLAGQRDRPAGFLQACRRGALRPAPPAGRRDLIRRVSYTLIGLPPEPAQIEAFLHDASPNAYEKLVDRLLASPHYGERWARHWLDLVRFAESEGFERDLPREHAWPYRDYLIRSFNDDKPYRQFAIEQLAGDVAEPVSHDSIVATTMLTPGPGRCRGPDVGPWGRASPDPRGLARGHAGHDHPDFLGPHRELRTLSRSQVRPDHAGRVLPDEIGVPSRLAPDPASA